MMIFPFESVLYLPLDRERVEGYTFSKPQSPKKCTPMPSKTKELQTFRISAANLLMLRSNPYIKYKGLLINMLFSAFFGNEMPALKYKFMQEVAKREQQRATKQSA